MLALFPEEREKKELIEFIYLANQSKVLHATSIKTLHCIDRVGYMYRVAVNVIVLNIILTILVLGYSLEAFRRIYFK